MHETDRNNLPQSAPGTQSNPGALGAQATDSIQSASSAPNSSAPNSSAPSSVTSNQNAQPFPQQTVLTVNAPKNRARTVALIAATILCVILCISAISCTATIGGITQSLGLVSSSETLDLEPKVAVISLGGSIQYDDTSCSPSGLKSLLDQAQSRDDIKAVVLRVNSGGGTATAGEEMAKYVSDFEKPIVVSCAATCASAAYEIASQSDYIFAAKTSAVGSIGVAMQVTNLSGLYEKLGIDIDNITSTESKDSTYGNRALTESERQWYQDMVDSINADFIATVASGRNMTEDEVSKLANGLTYTGEDASKNGLVDEVGYLDDAVSKASELGGYDTALESVPLSLSTTPDITSILDLLGEEESDEGTSKAQESGGVNIGESK